MADPLEKQLPAPPASIFLASTEASKLARSLTEAGYTVTTGESAPEESQDAVVLFDPPSGEILAATRRLLRGKGRLVVPWPDDPRPLTAALSEAGFVILKDGLARKEDFFVREYREGDEQQILPMFSRSFYVERSLARWSWEYRENPYGTLRISEAFTSGGKLVAHYAGYPVRFHREIDGETRKLAALQIGDTMTEPAFRHVGRGPTSLLGRTVRHYYARFCEGQVAFNFGFNTGNIQRFSMSFVGARRLEDLPFHVLDLEKRPIVPPNPVLSWLEGYRVERITHFDERWDDFFRQVSGFYRLLVERDARYLEWRYARCPDPESFIYAVFCWGRLVGWSVFRYKEDRLRWGDALFDPRYRGAVRQLLYAVLQEHRQAKTLETWITSRPAWWRKTLLALGFERRPEPDDLGFVFVPFGEDPEEAFRAHLYYTMGDSDLF